MVFFRHGDRCPAAAAGVDMLGSPRVQLQYPTCPPRREILLLCIHPMGLNYYQDFYYMPPLSWPINRQLLLRYRDGNGDQEFDNHEWIEMEPGVRNKAYDTMNHQDVTRLAPRRQAKQKILVEPDPEETACPRFNGNWATISIDHGCNRIEVLDRSKLLSHLICRW